MSGYLCHAMHRAFDARIAGLAPQTSKVILGAAQSRGAWANALLTREKRKPQDCQSEAVLHIAECLGGNVCGDDDRPLVRAVVAELGAPDPLPDRSDNEVRAWTLSGYVCQAQQQLATARGAVAHERKKGKTAGVVDLSTLSFFGDMALDAESRVKWGTDQLKRAGHRPMPCTTQHVARATECIAAGGDCAQDERNAARALLDELDAPAIQYLEQ